MDIHDIARAAKTFGVRHYYIVTPVTEQQQLVEKVLEHWLTGYGAAYNPSRKEAFGIIRLKDTLDAVREDIASLSGIAPKVVATGANPASHRQLLAPGRLRDEMMAGETPFLLLFGTGSGLTDEMTEQADFLLEPIQGPSDYNHLSVRSAVSILLDRLWGR